MLQVLLLYIGIDQMIENVFLLNRKNAKNLEYV